MKPEPLPRAARPLARHAEALLRQPADDGATGVDTQAAALTLVAQRIARDLGPRLARFSDVAPTVTAETPTLANGAAFTAGPFATHALFELAGSIRFVVSIDGTALLRMLDRTFGGRGEPPVPLPPALPPSAQLLAERVDLTIAQALTAGFGLAEGGGPAVLCRNGDLAQVSPFAAAEPLRLFAFSVAEAAGAPWPIALAFAEASTPQLLGTAKAAVARTAILADPCAAPFGDMPLRLTARLVDMAMPLARLSRLRVGDVLPVAVARQVPLHFVGQELSRPVARGTIGALDDRVAVQLTEAFR